MQSKRPALFDMRNSFALLAMSWTGTVASLTSFITHVTPGLPVMSFFVSVIGTIFAVRSCRARERAADAVAAVAKVELENEKAEHTHGAAVLLKDTSEEDSPE